MTKPKIFIGSSTEGIDIANAIAHNIENFCEPTIWSQNVFKLSMPTMTSLLNALETFDFAIFVFSPDDITTIRGTTQNTVRDNVIFEIGLFYGKLGTERVFFVKPKGSELHLPTDLLGVTSGEYSSDRSDNNLIAATGVFSNQVKLQVSEITKKIALTVSASTEVIDRKSMYLKDLKLLELYLKRKKWTSMSFQKIGENVNPKLTENYLMEIIEEFPEKISRCRIGEGKFGVKLLEN